MDCVASLSATVGSVKPAAVAFGFDGWSILPAVYRWAMGSWATAANFYQRCSFDGSGPMDGGASLREGGRTLHHASGRRRYSSASYAKLLGQQTVPVIGGEMPVIRGISLCPATPLDVIIPILSDVEVIQLLAVNPGYGSKMRSSDLHERVAQLLCLLGDKREGKIIVIDGSLTQDQLPSLIAQGINRVVSGSALFRDDRLVENTRSWRAMFKVAGDTTFLPSTA